IRHSLQLKLIGQQAVECVGAIVIGSCEVILVSTTQTRSQLDHMSIVCDGSAVGQFPVAGIVIGKANICTTPLKRFLNINPGGCIIAKLILIVPDVLES